MNDAPEWFEQIHDLQLSQNPDKVQELRAGGIDEETAVRLEFFYLSPGEVEARALVDFLRLETNYTVDVFERRDDMDENSPWLVVGMTQPTPVSLEVVDAWTAWMVAAGAQAGPCAFDGWSARTLGGGGPGTQSVLNGA